MTQTINDVFSKVIAFECRDANTLHVGSGTAFWLNVNGKVKLVTAAHIPWAEEPSPGSVFCVSWSMTNGRVNKGKAYIEAHPNASITDYAWIEFLDASIAPTGEDDPFQICPQPPSINTYVAATGFPGVFRTSDPKPEHAIGIVTQLQSPPGSKIAVAGRACGGYSGGPAFRFIDGDILGDEVIGLMCGAPHEVSNIEFGIASSYVLEGTQNFV